MTPERVEKMLVDLIKDGDKVLATERAEQFGSSVDGQLATRWAMSAISVLRSAFGTTSDHYQAIREYTAFQDLGAAVKVQATLQSALDAWRNGYIFSVQRLVHADVEASLIDQASVLLDASHTRAAAVVTGAVLEEHLRSISPSWGVSVEDANGKPRTLEPLNQDLKKAGAYDGIMQKRVTLVAGIRNEAAHGQPFENRDLDVKAMIGDVLRICSDIRAK